MANPMTDGLPTPRTILAARYVRVLVFCNSCRHRADADFNCSLPPACGRMQPTER